MDRMGNSAKIKKNNFLTYSGQRLLCNLQHLILLTNLI